MFIALIGTPSSGKNTIAQYLISKHEFRRIRFATATEGASSQGGSESEEEATIQVCREQRVLFPVGIIRLKR